MATTTSDYTRSTSEVEEKAPYRSPPRGSGELARLLDLAEALQEKREATLERIRARESQNTRIVGVGMLFSLGVGVYFWQNRDLATGLGIGFAVFLGAIMLFALISPNTTTALKERLRRDEKLYLMSSIY